MKKFTLLIAFLFSGKIFFVAILPVPLLYATIQQAINDASVGDTILVSANATYVGNLDFPGKYIIVRNTNPMADRLTTIIDGNSPGSVAEFIPNQTNSAVLEGFTLKTGKSLL